MTPDDRPFAVASRPPGWRWGKRIAVWGAAGFLGLMTLVALVSPSVTVPTVVGDDVSAAAAAISSAGLHAEAQGPNGQTVATTESSWHVAVQQPTAGATVSSGATVTLHLQTPSPETTSSTSPSPTTEVATTASSTSKAIAIVSLDAAYAEHVETDDGDAPLDSSRFRPPSAGLDSHQVDGCRSAHDNPADDDPAHDESPRSPAEDHDPRSPAEDDDPCSSDSEDHSPRGRLLPELRSRTRCRSRPDLPGRTWLPARPGQR